ncbi:MAG: DUF3566 domain-containing protein, partial [Aquihabitans sp.]
MSSPPSGPDDTAKGRANTSDPAGRSGSNRQVRPPVKTSRGRGPKRTPRPDAPDAPDDAGPTELAEPANGTTPSSRENGLSKGSTDRSRGTATGQDRSGTSSSGGSSARARRRNQSSPEEAESLLLEWESDPTTIGDVADDRHPPGPPTAPVASVPPVATSPVRSKRPAQDPDDRVAATGKRRSGRRVRRIVRRIDLWSVLKLATVLYTCLYVAVLATLALVWSIAYSSGQIDKVQSFLSDVGLENYRFYGDQMFRACAAIG